MFLAGCAFRPTHEELRNADYGRYPLEYERIIETRMFEILKDPSSAQYKFLGTPERAWLGVGGRQFGYAVCVYINAKNSFGGYTGPRLNYFMIRNGSIIRHFGGEDNFLSQGFTEGLCDVQS